MHKNLLRSEVAEFARCSHHKVTQAILGGALPAIDRGAGKTAGREARFLIRDTDAEAWVAAGCPISAPVKA